MEQTEEIKNLIRKGLDKLVEGMYSANIDDCERCYRILYTTLKEVYEGGTLSKDEIFRYGLELNNYEHRRLLRKYKENDA